MKLGNDFKQYAEDKINELKGEAVELEKKRFELAVSLDDINRQIKAWATIYETEFPKVEEGITSTLAKTEQSHRFADMKIGQALRIIRDDRPGIEKMDAFNILQQSGYDFKGKKPLPSVHFAWIALERELKNKSK